MYDRYSQRKTRIPQWILIFSGRWLYSGTAWRKLRSLPTKAWRSDLQKNDRRPTKRLSVNAWQFLGNFPHAICRKLEKCQRKLEKCSEKIWKPLVKRKPLEWTETSRNARSKLESLKINVLAIRSELDTANLCPTTRKHSMPG